MPLLSCCRRLHVLCSARTEPVLGITTGTISPHLSLPYLVVMKKKKKRNRRQRRKESCNEERMKEGTTRK
jgi:hypothetical protein